MTTKGGRRDELREVCARCGKTFGSHGAVPPHDRGDECEGFQSKSEQRR